jgi:putative hydrolase of the HAD superfamily
MKAIVLDMYGVIVKQTGDDFVPYVQRTFPDITPAEIYIPWFKADAGELTSREVWEAIGFQGDLEKTEKEYLDTIELNEGFPDFIAAVRKQYKLAIISNDLSRWSQYLREKFDINQYFDVISISGDLKIQKPDERIFLLTIEQLGCDAKDCLFVDDREGNLEAAGKLGMNTVLFNSRNVQYTGNTVNSFAELKNMLVRYLQYGQSEAIPPKASEKGN